MPFLSEIENLKILYKEIIDGYSWWGEHNLYVKHLDELENIEVTRYKLSLFADYVKQGILSSEDKLKSLIESEQWDAGKEDRILTLKYNISDNEKNLKNIIPEQQPPIKRVIEGFKVELGKLLGEKREMLGMTADVFAERKSFNYMIYMSLYDNKFAKMYSSFDRFEEQVEDSDLILYGELVEQTLLKITHKVVTQIAVMPFFLNNLSYSKDNIYYFLGRPMVHMSHYQAALLSLGSRNLSVLSNTKSSPPDLIEDVAIDDIVLFYDKEFSILSSKSANNS